MDILLKYLILGGKYLTKITANSIIEAYNRSISLTNRLSNQYENSLCILNPYENILELYNTHLEEFNNSSEMHLAFISDKHKKEFDSYLKEIECKDLAEFLNSQDFNKNSEHYLKRMDKGVIILQPSINSLPCGVHSSNETMFMPKINMYHVPEDYKVKNKTKSLQNFKHFSPHDNLTKSMSETGERFHRENVDNTLRDIGKAQKYIQETCTLIHKLNCHACKDLCKLEEDTARSTEVLLKNKDALSSRVVEELEERLLELQLEIEDNERILLENHTQFKLLEQKLSNEILKKQIVDIDEEVEPEVLLSFRKDTEQLPYLDEKVNLKIEGDILLNISQTEFDKFSKGLVNKMLKIVPPMKRSKDLIPLPLEYQMKIDSNDIKDRSKILEINKQAFDELESHLRVVKIIKKNEEKVNNLQDDFNEVLSRKLPEIKNNANKPKGLNMRPLNFMEENLGFTYNQPNMRCFVRKFKTYSQVLNEEDKSLVEKVSTHDFGTSAVANAASYVYENQEENENKKGRIPKWKFTPNKNKKVKKDPEKIVERPPIKESSVYNILKREMVTLDNYGTHLAKVKKQKDKLLAAKSRFENFKPFAGEEETQEGIKEVDEETDLQVKFTECQKRKEDYRGPRVLKKKWNCSFSDKLKCIKIESTDVIKTPTDGLQACKEKLSWIPKKETRIDIKFVPTQSVNLNLGHNTPIDEIEVLKSIEKNNACESTLHSKVENETIKKPKIKVSKSLSAVQKVIENIEKDISKSNIDISLNKSHMKIENFKNLLSSTQEDEPIKSSVDSNSKTKISDKESVTKLQSRESLNTVENNLMSNSLTRCDYKENLGDKLVKDRVLEITQKSQSLHQIPKIPEKIKIQHNRNRIQKVNKSIIDSIDEEIARINIATETKSLNSLSNQTVVPEIEINKNETVRNNAKFEKKLEKVNKELKIVKQDDLKLNENNLENQVLNETKVCNHKIEDKIENLDKNLNNKDEFNAVLSNKDINIKLEKEERKPVTNEIVDAVEEKVAQSKIDSSEVELVKQPPVVVALKVNEEGSEEIRGENASILKQDLSKNVKTLTDDLKKIRMKRKEQRDNMPKIEIKHNLEKEKLQHAEIPKIIPPENNILAKENLTDKIKYLKKMKDSYNPKVIKPTITPKVVGKRDTIQIEEESAQNISVSAVSKNIDIIKEKKAKMLTSQIMQDKLKIIKPKSTSTIGQNIIKPKDTLPESKSKSSLQQKTNLENKGFVLVNYNEKEVELAMKNKKCSIKQDKTKAAITRKSIGEVEDKIIYLGDGLNKMENVNPQDGREENILKVSSGYLESKSIGGRKDNLEVKSELSEPKLNILQRASEKELKTKELNANVIKKMGSETQLQSKVNIPKLSIKKIDCKNQEVMKPIINVSKTHSERKIILLKPDPIPSKVNLDAIKQNKEKANVEKKTLLHDVKILEDNTNKEGENNNIVKKLQVEGSKTCLDDIKIHNVGEDLLKHTIVQICVDSLKANCEKILKKQFQMSDINPENVKPINLNQEDEQPKLKNIKSKASYSNYLFNNKMLEQNNSEKSKNKNKVYVRNDDKYGIQSSNGLKETRKENIVNVCKTEGVKPRTAFPVKGEINLKKFSSLSHKKNIYTRSDSKKIKNDRELDPNSPVKTESKTVCTQSDDKSKEKKSINPTLDTINIKSAIIGEQSENIYLESDVKNIKLSLAADCVHIKYDDIENGLMNCELNPFYGLIQNRKPDHTIDIESKIVRKTINNNTKLESLHEEPKLVKQGKDFKYGKAKKGENIINLSNNNKSVHQFRSCDNYGEKNENISRRDDKGGRMKNKNQEALASGILKYPENDVHGNYNMVFLHNEGLNKIMIDKESSPYKPIENNLEFETFENKYPEEYFIDISLSESTSNNDFSENKLKAIEKNDFFSNLINTEHKGKVKKCIKEKISNPLKVIKMKCVEKFIEITPKEKTNHQRTNSALHYKPIEEELIDGKVWFWETNENCIKPFHIKKLEPIKEEINNKTFHIRRIKSFLSNALAVTYLVEEPN